MSLCYHLAQPRLILPPISLIYDRTEDEGHDTRARKGNGEGAVPQIDLTLLDSPVKGPNKRAEDVGVVAELVDSADDEGGEGGEGGAVVAVERAIEELPSAEAAGTWVGGLGRYRWDRCDAVILFDCLVLLSVVGAHTQRWRRRRATLTRRRLPLLLAQPPLRRPPAPRTHSSAVRLLFSL